MGISLFAQIPGHILSRTDLSDNAKILYGTLAMHALHKGECWPGVELLAQEAGRSERTVTRGLTELEQAGLIERQQRRRETAIIVLKSKEIDLVEGDVQVSQDGHKRDPYMDQMATFWHAICPNTKPPYPLFAKWRKDYSEAAVLGEARRLKNTGRTFETSAYFVKILQYRGDQGGGSNDLTLFSPEAPDG